MDFKVDMFIKVGAFGATETLYMQASDWVSAMARADLLGQARAQLFPALTKMEGIRVSDLAFKRDSKVIVSDKYKGKKFALHETDHYFSTQYIRLNSENHYWRSLHLSGIPDAVHEGILVESAFRPAWEEALKTYIKFLVDTPFYIRAIDKTTIGVPKPIQTVGQGDANGYVEIGVTAHGYSNLDKVRISGATGAAMEYINGVRTVFGATDNAFKIVPTDATANFVYTGNGTVAVRRHLLKPITDGTILALRPRQRGTGNFLRTSGSRRRQQCHP